MQNVSDWFVLNKFFPLKHKHVDNFLASRRQITVTAVWTGTVVWRVLHGRVGTEVNGAGTEVVTECTQVAAVHAHVVTAHAQVAKLQTQVTTAPTQLVMYVCRNNSQACMIL